MSREIFSDESTDPFAQFEWSPFTSDEAATIPPQLPKPIRAGSHDPSLAELLVQIRQIIGQA
jgi:hypothetical protein